MTDHDERYDVATELCMVAKLLTAEDKIVQSIWARELAAEIYHDGIHTAEYGWAKLGEFENMLEGA